MEPTSAPQAADPRLVTTPLIPTKIEELLQALGIFEPWKHIPAGLRTGFNIGINHSLPHTHLFRKSRILVS